MASAMTYDSLVSDLQDYLDRNNTQLQNQIPNFITLGEIRCSREVKNLGTKTTVVTSLQAGVSTYQKPARWLETCSINFGSGTLYATTFRQAASGVRTITLSAAHNLSVGDAVTVSGLGSSGYNGNFTVSAVTQFTISYSSGSLTEAMTADNGGFASAPLENRVQLLPRSYEYVVTYWPDRTERGTPRFYADYNYGYWLIAPTPQINNPVEITYYQRPDPLSTTNQTNWFTEYARDLLLYACLLEAVPYLKNDQRIEVWKDYYRQSATAIKMENKDRINDANIKRDE